MRCGERAQHTGICATIASELAVVPGRVVLMDELIDVVYRGVREPKSGPARVIVTMSITSARPGSQS